MNILYVVNKDPRDKTSGNAQRTNLLWNALKRKGRVFTIVALDGVERCQYITGENPICIVKPKVKKIRWKMYYYIDKISGLSVLPFPEVPRNYYSSLFPNEGMDVAVCRYVRSLRYDHLWDSLPVYVDIDDHPRQVYDTIIKKRLPAALRPFGKCMNRWQMKYVLGKITGGWLSNGEQLQWCNEKIKYLPNIPQAPSSDYLKDNGRERYIITIGTMSYRPNYLGVNHFLNEIWPKFHSCHPDIVFIIGGKGAPWDMAERWNASEGVRYIGFVEDLEGLYSKALAAVIPVYSGGGTCIKTLEAMAYSRVGLTTPFGARGLPSEDLTPENGICVFNHADEFISAFEQVLDPESRDRMESGACRYASQHFSVDDFLKAVDQVLDGEDGACRHSTS